MSPDDKAALRCLGLRTHTLRDIRAHLGQTEAEGRAWLRRVMRHGWVEAVGRHGRETLYWVAREARRVV